MNGWAWWALLAAKLTGETDASWAVVLAPLAPTALALAVVLAFAAWAALRSRRM